MLEFLTQHRQAIRDELQRFIDSREDSLAQISDWGRDVTGRLKRFADGGKMLRGALVMLAATDRTMKPHPAAVRPAAAMELFQTFLLIHDDIMDRDTERRGEPALYYQYVGLAEDRGIDASYHFGQSMGICAGDIALFLAMELLAETNVDAEARVEIIGLCSRELGYTGLAQMSDLSHGHTREEIGEERITAVYRYKTARYSFSLPLMLGSTVAGHRESTRDLLARIGERLGIVFQMKDDELGLFGDAESLGKPVGSDISEDKKTMHREYLFRAASPVERERLLGIFGKEVPTEEELTYIYDLLAHYDVRRHVLSQMETYRAETASLIGQLESVPAGVARGLTELLDYNIARTS